MHSIITSVQSQSETIKRLAGQANTVAALLSVFDSLPHEAKQSVLAHCADIADDIASDLFAAKRGAA